MFEAPSAIQVQLRQACSEMERRLRAGDHYTSEDLFASYPDLRSYVESALELIYTEFVVRQELGESPTPASYIERFPQWSDDLRILFQVSSAMVGSTVHDEELAPRTPRAAGGSNGMGPGRRFGSYELLEEIGRGAMGVVYKARQEKLKRIVALKVILAGEHAGLLELGRFRAEGEAAARLQHPNIVQVFEVGEHDGRPYFALEYVDGGSLEPRLAQGPLRASEAAALLEKLARAIHHAHQRGIIHRDLKPTNILLTVDGEPKITDFGLAKRVENEAGQTKTGAIVGTPSYMAPEQAAGKGKHVGPAADIYALGVILYEALTGRPPFEGATVTDALEQVRYQEPVPPSRLQPKVPRDLETICLKCLEKEPGKRYADAEALALDLRRFQSGEAIIARPTGAFERALKWARRRPTVAALLGVCAMALLALMGVVVGFSAILVDRNRSLEQNLYMRQRAEQEARHRALEAMDAARNASEREVEAIKAREETEQEKGKADRAAALARAQRDQARSYLFTAQLLRAGAEYRSEPERAMELLNDYDACPIDLRDTAWRFLENACRGKKSFDFALTDGRALTAPVAFSHDRKLLASVGQNNHVDIWDIVAGQRLSSFPGPEANVLSLAFSPDGKTLALGCADETVRLWDAGTGKERLSLAKQGDRVFYVAFTPDSKTLASLTQNDKRVRLWNVVTGKEINALAHDGYPRFAHFSPDDKMLVTGDDNGGVLLWETSSGKVLATFRHLGSVTSGAFSPDGRTIVSAGFDKTIRLWDVATGKQLANVKPLANPRAVAFSPDSKTLAYSDDTGVVRLCEAATGKERAMVPHGGTPNALVFSAVGDALVSVSIDGKVRRWPMAAPAEHGLLPSRSSFTRSVAFSRDGSTLVSSGSDGTVELWDVATGQQRGVLQGHEKEVRSVAISPDGQTVVSGSADGTVRVWDVATGKERANFRLGNLIVAVAMRPDGRTLASVWLDSHPQTQKFVSGGIKLWDLTTLKEIASLEDFGSAVRSIAFSPDGKTLVSGENRGDVRFWDPATGKEQRALKHGPGICAIAFSPDGSSLASTRTLNGKSAEIIIWDFEKGEQRGKPIEVDSIVWSIAFSPDGKTLATGDQAHSTRLWDLSNGRERAEFKEKGAIFSVAFSPDGRLLAIGGAQDHVIVRQVVDDKARK